MKHLQEVNLVHCHAAGEVGDVIVSGVAPPPGESLWAQSRFIASDGALRNYVLNEPRGGVFRHVNLLVPPKHPAAQMGFIIMEPEDTPPMSGSNSICVATVLLETGILPMVEPVTDLVLEAPGGMVQVRADCHAGKVTRVTVQNLPSFAGRLGAKLEVEGLGILTVDTGFGGDSFVMVDARDLGFEIAPHEARDLAEIGIRITNAANQQWRFEHPTNPDWTHFSFCQIHAPMVVEEGVKTVRNAVAIQPGKIDRSPTGTAVSARMAVLHAKGELTVGEAYRARSIIGASFDGKIIEETKLGRLPAIIPQLSGQAWITGRSTLQLDPSDPWPEGYRLSDTWPISKSS